MRQPISPIQALSVSGLPEREARIWHALSVRGPLNISQIARATTLHRPAIYATLPALIDKQLIKQVTGRGRATYRTTGVTALTAWRASHDRAFAVHMRTLKQQETPEDISEDVRVYHGKNIRRVWEEVLASTARKSVFYRYDGYAPSIKVSAYMPPGYYENIEKRYLDRFVITNQALRTSAYKKRLECASRMLPKSFDAFEQGVSQFIFGDKIAFIDFTTETAIVVTNAALAKYQARVFQFLYRSLPE